MKANDIRQINGFFNKSFFEVIKLFFVYCLMNNPIFSFYPASQNLKAIGLQFFKLIYIDFSRSLNNSIVIFISINCHKYYLKKHIFINKSFGNYLFMTNHYKSYIGLLKNPIGNNKGFMYCNLIESIFKFTFFIILSFLIALITSLSDIDIPSYQEAINNMQYMLKDILVFF